MNKSPLGVFVMLVIMKQEKIIFLLWLSVLLVLPLFTLLGMVLPPLEMYKGGLIVINNTWIVAGYGIFIVLAPIVALVTGAMLSLQKPCTKTKVIVGLLATIVSAFLVYLFAMFVGFFTMDFLDQL